MQRRLVGRKKNLTKSPVLPPGGRGCSHNLQCTQAYPEATCFLQTCTCPINFPIPIDGTCGRNCSAGETYSGVTGQCLPSNQFNKLIFIFNFSRKTRKSVSLLFSMSCHQSRHDLRQESMQMSGRNGTDSSFYRT